MQFKSKLEMQLIVGSVRSDTDVLYLNIAGTELIVLDTAKAALDLLESRSSLYSGR